MLTDVQNPFLGTPLVPLEQVEELGPRRSIDDPRLTWERADRGTGLGHVARGGLVDVGFVWLDMPGYAWI